MLQVQPGDQLMTITRTQMSSTQIKHTASNFSHVDCFFMMLITYL